MSSMGHFKESPELEGDSDSIGEIGTRNGGEVCAGHDPIVLSGVCRQWRDIALTTPRLWSTIIISLDHIASAVISHSRAEIFMEQWLNRAAVLPLTMVLQSAKPRFPLNRLRSIIHHYSDRVQYLALDIGERDIRELALDSKGFPNLRRATLDWDAPYTFESEVPIKVLGMATTLDGLHLPHAVRYPLKLIAPWSQLTRFEGEIENTELFALAVNLTEAKCCLVADDDGDIVAHTSLQSLIVTGESADILALLTLSSLRYLDICGMQDHNSLRRFLIRSSPPLLTLCVRGEIQLLDEWYDCLPLIGSSLENLEIHHVSHSVMVPLFSANRKKNLLILPNLKALRCCDVQRDSVNLAQVVAFLYSRSGQLHSFRLVWETSPFWMASIFN
ncbi:hypothetical protein B0H13DRAFT_2361985 [Mycena leptocephala]|nr:hypothetical protein B0H13DRAFT_2361985 [Mycena leptocephala]